MGVRNTLDKFALKLFYTPKPFISPCCINQHVFYSRFSPSVPPHANLISDILRLVVVKWQGKKYDIVLETSEPGSTFKFQIFSLTGVPPERQKVLVKGGQLKDDQDMSLLGLKPGHNFMLLGTAEQGFKVPEMKTVFVEDMSTAEMAKSVHTALYRCSNARSYNLLA
jgi:Ubiquitin family